jgi:serine/threonine protein kinase/Tfp pilus assembly protein PilF
LDQKKITEEIESLDTLLDAVNVPDQQWRLGNYEILEEVGRGGMGVIYRARQRHSRRIVAVKRVLSYHADSRETLERFRREAEAAASLDHPNILPIYEVSESDDGLPFFSMKFATGGSLREAARCLQREPRRCVALVAKIARATECAHRQGILHRDLKPGNILLDARGEPMVSDFGLAKWLDTKSDLTRTLTIFGTPGYIAPEQAHRTAAQLTPAADVYSLGAILFDLLAGRPPFIGAHALSVIRQASESPAPKLRSLSKAADRDLETVCAKCLEREPAQRYRSAAELAEDLERWLTRRPIQARPVLPSTRAWRWSRRNPALIGAAATGILLGAIAIWVARIPATAFVPPPRSIAVLPFVDLSENKNQEYFCDGISEEIRDSLSKVEGLAVTSRASSFSFKDKAANVQSIGERLNVANLLEGTLRREGNRVRVTAELVNVRDGFKVWSQTFDREVADVFALEDEIARAITDALKVRFALTPRSERNSQAYDLYLQGLFFSNKSSEEDLRRAVNFFERALAIEPNFARAWTGIAKSWYFLADVYVEPLIAYPKSRDAAVKALELDNKDAEAHCYLSEAKRVLDWDLVEQEAELQRALALDPQSWSAHFFGALIPLFRGDVAEGLRLALETEKLDPVSPITSYVTTAAYLANQRIDNAVAEGERTMQLDPTYFYLDSNLAAAYREKGRFEQAIALYIKAQEMTGIPSSGLAITYARIGRAAEAREVLNRLLERRTTRYVSAPTIAAVYVSLGEKENAFRWLTRAYEEHSGLLQWIAFLPQFRPLQTDPRFDQLLRETGVKRVVSIAETTLTKVVDATAAERLNLTITLKLRPHTDVGHRVRINVSFYDLTKENRMAPTMARVDYKWLTPPQELGERKELAATYVRPDINDGRRYGGYSVRVYFDGQLQDTRATPAELLKLFPE